MKILCLGDSLTEGFEIPKKSRWTNLLESELNISAVNAGISGDTTSGMLARCERLILSEQPSHMIILGGTNDLWFGLNDELILSNIHAMSRCCKHYDIAPILGIITPSVNLNEMNLVGENYSECIRSFRNSLLRYCRDDEQTYIDFGQGLTFAHFKEDGIHPNKKGQMVMKENARTVITTLLQGSYE